MTKRVQMVLVCEDKQHHVFARRFLRSMGWDVDRLRIEAAPPGRGAADQFVRSRLSKELESLPPDAVLLVMLDGDAKGPAERLRELNEAGRDAQMSKHRDRTFVFVPTWNIETWLAYLNGMTVDETNRHYPRLARQRECQEHVDELVEMCRHGGLRQPAPPSLVAACEEYHRLTSAH